MAPGDCKRSDAGNPGNGTAQEMEPETRSREGADAGQEVEEVFVYRVQTGAFAHAGQMRRLCFIIFSSRVFRRISSGKMAIIKLW